MTKIYLRSQASSVYHTSIDTAAPVQDAHLVPQLDVYRR